MTENAAPGTPSRAVGQVAIAVTVFLLGFLLAVQLRTQEGLADRLAIERESDLGQILTELTSRSDRLLEEIVDLRVKLAQTSGSEAQERALIESAREQLEALRILLGIVPARGPGIEMTIADPQGTVGPDVLLDAIQELRDAGAEAIQINDVRVVASTSVGGVGGALTLGGIAIRAPYGVRAIGSASTLAEGMRIPSGVVDALGAREGASVRITERSTVSILSVTTVRQFEIGRPSRRR
ncbi:MAG TPA: DUF881 domain-containing protein [Actinomycetota bacterium]|nr:DUF881 domain-containing protein [Actinomycetota bacterium]